MRQMGFNLLQLDKVALDITRALETSVDRFDQELASLKLANFEIFKLPDIPRGNFLYRHFRPSSLRQMVFLDVKIRGLCERGSQ